MYIGIDIGGTNIRVAATVSLCRPHIVNKIVFPNDSDYTKNERNIIQAIQKLSPTVAGIGIGMIGRLNQERTGITHTLSAPQWVDKPIVASLTKAFNRPVILNGDQYCTALSEAMVEERTDDFFCIVYGTGLGCARVTYQHGKPSIQRVSDEEHATFLRPWQADCGGKWAKDTYGKPLEKLSETEWTIVMDHFYAHLLTFVHGMKPPRLVFGGGVAVKQWTRLQSVFDRLRADQVDLHDFEIGLVHYGEDAALYGAFGLLEEVGVLK